MRKISDKRQRAMVDDVFNAEHDVVGLAAAHGLTPGELATWAQRPATRSTLGGLCLLADLQAQLLLSRYRLVAVTRLIEQATGRDAGGEGITPEQARKACETLLRADLKHIGELTSNQPHEGDDGDALLAELRAAMGRDADDDPAN